MANVKFNGRTFYVHSDKFLIGLKERAPVYKTSSSDSQPIAAVEEGQVFAVSSQANGMYHIKAGWINQTTCDVLVEASNEIKDLAESFVVKVISTIPILTEPSIGSHTATVLRVGDLERVVGESEDFFKLEHGGFIEKRGCRRY